MKKAKAYFINKDINIILNIFTRIFLGYLFFIYFGSYEFDFEGFNFSFTLISMTFLAIALNPIESWSIFFLYVLTLFFKLNWGWLKIEDYNGLFTYSSIEIMSLIIPLTIISTVNYKFKKSNPFVIGSCSLIGSWFIYFCFTAFLLQTQYYSDKSFLVILIDSFLKNILIYFSFGIMIIILSPSLRTKINRENKIVVKNEEEV